MRRGKGWGGVVAASKPRRSTPGYDVRPLQGREYHPIPNGQAETLEIPREARNLKSLLKPVVGKSFSFGFQAMVDQ